MSIDTRQGICIRQALIYIVYRVIIRVSVKMIPRLRAPENIRRIHTIKYQNRQNCINKPYHPVILFFSDLYVCIHPEKYNQFCQKQQNHQRQRLCVPAISPTILYIPPYFNPIFLFFLLIHVPGSHRSVRSMPPRNTRQNNNSMAP